MNLKSRTKAMGRLSAKSSAFRNASAEFSDFRTKYNVDGASLAVVYGNIKRYGNYSGVILIVAKSTGFDLHSARFSQKQKLTIPLIYTQL